MRLIAIPYAFGSANIYLDLFHALNGTVSTTAIEYSGHGRRINDQLLTSMDSVADDVYRQIEGILASGEDYCLLGYSMGGLVAYELYYKILAAGRKLPQHIFILGTPEPQYLHAQKDYESFDFEQIKAELTAHDGTPDELLDCDELIELLMPIVKADCIALRDYRWQKRDEQVHCGVTVIRGSLEPNLEHCRELWETCIGHEIEYLCLEGKHFFLFEQEGRYTGQIAELIAERLAFVHI